MREVPQEQEYPGSPVWPGYWYCDNCDYSEDIPIDESSVRENTRGF